MKSKTLALFTVLILTFSTVKLAASPQMPDYLIYKSDTVSTFNLLVEKYLQSLPQPDSGRLFGLSFRNGASFNCWRGYQAIYKIENDSLFVADMIPCGSGFKKTDKAYSGKLLSQIFGNKVKENKVFIDWFSGDISYPLNRTQVRWDQVFYRIFEKERVMGIASGKVLQTEDVTNYVDDPKGIDRKYNANISKILFKQIKEVNWKKLRECDCFNKYVITIGRDGTISNVALAEQPADDTSKNEDDICKSEMLAVLRKLKFDIIKDRGKPMEELVYLEIWVDANGKVEDWTND